MEMATIFTEKQKELLIELVGQRPAIYLKQDKFGKDVRVARRNDWNDIWKDMKEEYPSLTDLTIKDVMHEWAKLRNIFRVVQGRLAKGSGNEPVWRFWKNFQFMRCPIERTLQVDADFLDVIKQEIFSPSEDKSLAVASPLTPQSSEPGYASNCCIPTFSEASPAASESYPSTSDSNDLFVEPTMTTATSLVTVPPSSPQSSLPLSPIVEVPPLSPPTSCVSAAATTVVRPRKKRRRTVLPAGDRSIAPSVLPTVNTSGAQSKFSTEDNTKQHDRSVVSSRQDDAGPPTQHRHYVLSIEQQLLQLTDYQAAVARRNIETALFNAKYSVPPHPTVSHHPITSSDMTADSN